MFQIAALRGLIFLTSSLLAVRAQSTSTTHSTSTTSSASTDPSTSIDASPHTGFPPLTTTENYFIPTVRNDTQILEQDLYVSNNSLVIFSIYNNTDYPSYYNDDMFDIDTRPIDSLSLCIRSCVDYSISHSNDKGPVCQGVAYISGLCWRKNGFSEGSTFYSNKKAISAIMHLLQMTQIN